MSADQLMSFQISRRDLLLSVAGTAAFSATSSRAQPAAPGVVVSLDYGVASTLMALGIVPAAVASLADWDIWVVEPEMPPSVMDLGNAWEVNFEILTTLQPDLILTTPYLDALKPRLDALGQVLRLDVYSAEGGDILPKAIAATRQLGTAVGREQEAEAFLQSAELFFDECRERIAALNISSVALVSFLDARHARVYGSPGLYDNILQRLGLQNAWTGQATYWGFDTIGIEQLSRISDPTALLIALEPIPGDVLPKLSTSPLWNALPFVRADNFSVMPGSLMFGMVNDAMRFARLLTDHLETVA
ncbi:ABC transporter substrate-binding protein [Ciceribacter sp. L1K22]|nr:ABC transporter substrate-binding protein [Ciceribacter sp. L1K22]